MAKIILFVDALEPTEYGDGWTDTERGLVESGFPKVTPKVTSEVYTGASPSQNGMGAAHTTNQAPSNRPRVPTIQEKLEMAGYNVLSLFMPYALPLQLQNQAWVSTAMGQSAAGQNPFAQLCQQPPVGGEMASAEADWDRIYNGKVEDIYAKSSSMLNSINMGGFDIAFIGIRTPDEYTHFQWHEEYRHNILEIIAQEVGRWQTNHEILWWSDHGSEEKKEVFRINRWLIEKGYLNIDIDLEYAERFSEDMQQMNPQDQQQGESIENQLGVHQPGVEIEEDSQAICTDPYDSCITMLDDGADRSELIYDMEDSGYYEEVGKTEDIWGEGEFIDICPDIVTLRADNVLVGGNVHPEPLGMGFMRSGVHSKFGAWGTTDNDFKRIGDVTPQELHDVIWEFVTGSSQIEQEVMSRVNQMEEQMQQIQRQQEQMQDALGD